MAFENFPYANFHELNLDWILERVKEAYSASNPPDYPVKSVNGMTGDVIIAIPSALVRTVNGESGDVILYRNPLIQFPTTDESRWNLFRICDGNSGDARGIEFDEDGAHRIEGTRRILIYDEENQPDFPVTSVNGQTGDVRITAGVNSVNGKTGNVVTPFVNPNADILTLDSNSNTVLWGISRNVSGGNVALYISRGTGTPQAFIRYTPDGGEPVNLPLLTNADIPAEAGVLSVNTKTGAVTLYANDILLASDSALSIKQAIDNITTLIDTLDAKTAFDISIINDTIFTETIGNPSEWSRGVYNPQTGEPVSGTRYLRLNVDLPKYSAVKSINGNIGFYVVAWNAENEFQGLYLEESNSFELTDGHSDALMLRDVNLAKIWNTYPDYRLRVEARYIEQTTIYTTAATGIAFYMYRSSGDIPDINQLRETVATHTQQIAALQAADDTHDQQITALQAADTTHSQQISALQNSDTAQNQQISALQSADSTHDQQITALQEKDNTQDQQISELYTRTGIYAVTISNANTLPLRYPATGTDAKIKDTNKVVSMDVSIPGVQTSNWTITTYDGYLEITGTINGVTDITLYLA